MKVFEDRTPSHNRGRATSPDCHTNGPSTPAPCLGAATSDGSPPNDTSDGAAQQRRALIQYIAPILVFGLFTAGEQYLPRALYGLAYFVKICAVTISLLLCRRPLRDIRPSRKGLTTSIVIGLAVFVAWVGIDKTVPYPHLGERVGYDPFGGRILGEAAFLIVRFYGLVLVVPVMEELFWRSFVLRYMTDADFLSLPIGTFSPTALGVMVVVSGIAHPEWLVAVVASGAYAWWLRRSRSLFATIVSHATTNAALGVYILATHDWKYW